MSFTREQQKAFQRYEDIKIEMRLLDAELESLKPIILPLVEEGKQIMGSHGYFEKRFSTRWKYSPAVTELQKEEKAKGIAKKNEITSLYYVQENKDKEE